MKIKLLFIIATVFIIVVSLLGLAAIYISPQDKLEKADVILAISGGDTPSRALEAVNLYKDGWAPNIIFSGAALDPTSPSNAEVMRDIAKENGVPDSAIRIEEEARDTEENAERSKSLLEEFEYKKVILVTSPYHQRRAHLEFKNAVAGGMTIINHSALDDEWSRNTWWQSPRGWWLTFSELVKLPFVVIRGWL